MKRRILICATLEWKQKTDFIVLFPKLCTSQGYVEASEIKL